MTNAMTMRECIEALLASKDAEQIRLQVVCRFLDISPNSGATLQNVLSGVIDQDYAYANQFFHIENDGIYRIGATTPYYRIIRGA